MTTTGPVLAEFIEALRDKLAKDDDYGSFSVIEAIDPGHVDVGIEYLQNRFILAIESVDES